MDLLSLYASVTLSFAHVDKGRKSKWKKSSAAFAKNVNQILEIKRPAKWPGHDWEIILFIVKQIQWLVYPDASAGAFLDKKITAFVFEICNSNYSM